MSFKALVRTTSRRRLKAIFVLLVMITILFLILKKRQVVTSSVCAREPLPTTLDPVYPDEFVSKILVSHAKPKPKSQTNYVSNLRFGHEKWIDGQPLLTGPPSYQPDRKASSEVREFLSRQKLILTPFDTDVLSPYLTTTRQVINEAQRVHFNLFKDLFRGKKYAVLFQFATHENKGDSAIGMGEVMLLERMGIKLLFYLDHTQNRQKDYERALAAVWRYPKEEVVVLLSGGGNIFGYREADEWRKRALAYFKQYSVILLPQSICMKGNKNNFQLYHKLYCCDPNLTIILRDRLSLQIAQRIFNNGTRLLLAPDIAFQLGPLTRQTAPFYDISWLKRSDGERPVYSATPESGLSANLTFWIWDWLQMKSIPSDNILMKASNIVENGLSILQRGRVVVTDRLHGHILCTLLDIPHVLLDNAENKLSSYHNTWTRGLTNCRLASSVQEASRLAVELLEEFKDVLPQRITAVDLKL